MIKLILAKFVVFYHRNVLLRVECLSLYRRNVPFRFTCSFVLSPKHLFAETSCRRIVHRRKILIAEPSVAESSVAERSGRRTSVAEWASPKRPIPLKTGKQIEEKSHTHRPQAFAIAYLRPLPDCAKCLHVLPHKNLLLAP